MWIFAAIRYRCLVSKMLNLEKPKKDPKRVLLGRQYVMVKKTSSRNNS